MLSAVIVAGGMSRRMGRDKTFAQLAGKPALAWSIEAFAATTVVIEIIVVTRADAIETAQSLKKYAQGKAYKVVVGGAERYLSVWEGLKAVAPDANTIAVHDGARPLITPQDVVRTYEACLADGAAACAAPVVETLKRTDAEGRIRESIDRRDLWLMQTPQIFAAALLRQAYAKVIASDEQVTDETSAVQRLGARVRIVETTRWNIKITLPGDFTVAEHLLRLREQ